MPSLTERAYTANKEEVTGYVNKPVIIHVSASCGGRSHGPEGWKFNRQRAPLSYQTYDELASTMEMVSKIPLEEHVEGPYCVGLFVETRAFEKQPGPNDIPFTIVTFFPAGTALINPT